MLTFTGAVDPSTSVQLEAFVLTDPERRVRVSARPQATGSSAIAGSEVGVEPSEAPAPLQTVARRVMAQLQSPDCSVPLPEPQDLALLALDERQRSAAAAWLPSIAGNTQQACRLARQATGRWKVRPDRVGVLVSGSGKLMELEADLRMTGGGLCMGPIRVSRVAP